LGLLQQGFMSKAANLLTGFGLGDTSDPKVVAQLRKKHPQATVAEYDRRRVLATDIVGAGVAKLPDLDIREHVRKLPDRSGTGPDGSRNEFLKALVQKFSDPEAAKAIDALSDFEGLYSSGGLPLWFYPAYSGTLLLALNKKAPVPGETTGARPLGLKNVVPRLFSRSRTHEAKAEIREYLGHTQVAVGHSDGSGLLVNFVREMLIANPSFIVAKADIDNAFMEFFREIVFETLADGDVASGLPAKARGHLQAPFLAEYMQPHPIFFPNGERADFDSQRGGDQGDPRMPTIFCIALRNVEIGTQSGRAAERGQQDMYVQSQRRIHGRAGRRVSHQPPRPGPEIARGHDRLRRSDRVPQVL